VIFEGAQFRVVRAAEPGLPAFYRLVWTQHVREFTDLPRPARLVCLDAVACVEEALRTALAPAKVNLAALGNAVPHLHWHVIARFDWDSHFPDAVWAPPRRVPAAQQIAGVQALLPAMEAALAQTLARLR